MSENDRLTQPVSLIALPYVMGTRTPHPFNFRFGDGTRALFADQQAPKAVRSVFSDVEVTFIEDVDEPGERRMGSRDDGYWVYHGDQMSRILVQNIRLAQVVSEARARGRIPIASIGICSASLGMVAGVGDAEGDIGMIWFDCHGDAQTPETSSNGFFEAMPVATIAGQCWKNYRRRIPGFREIPEERIVSVGLASMFDPDGVPGLERALGELVHKPKIDALGYEKAITEALDLLKSRCNQVYIHIDADVLDTSVLAASSLISNGGLTPEQISFSLDQIADRFEILAVAFSAFDPHEDPRGCDVLVPLVKHAALAAERSRSVIR
ncbi:arginase family protein [Rhizobium hainanense]|uniref:Arginase n=1 Tax=Rhizobium hainanense TaxID=52131 RepID=A0A1C3W9D5_9HYPH|nr:arginase family protein [Rhizobium hainanense]SCB36516.1 arginase [Rhizobium hainanense]